ncbi:hypothetical protein COY07_04350 [Candidatus Peregrinibacteria bacterium CG_4_10_14_0_2_um_filter_43_11]|nr:MAG: hypothetical protein COY07_04350 [Candidatus Peregrinibacteria bacterium CG_4_10_14_0_2_um_filter_43_11]
MSTQLSIAFGESPDPAVKVVTLTGEMDEISLETLKNQMDPVLNDSAIKAVIFDLQNLSFINSKGIGYLVAVHTHLAKDHRKLLLARAQEAVMDVISLVGLTSIIPHFESPEKAFQGAL